MGHNLPLPTHWTAAKFATILQTDNQIQLFLIMFIKCFICIHIAIVDEEYVSVSQISLSQSHTIWKNFTLTAYEEN